ncbi:MAG TPA: glycoside hydrolase family 88 protein [Bryobacteraceae bacterium]|nr:glycoside hydrolase family 88 protein [Bryobacteraceae bacterium]
MNSLSRRQALGLIPAAVLGTEPGSVLSRLPAGTPPGVAAIISDTLRSAPGSHNTDWFGTLLMQGLLNWGKQIPEAGEFAKAWMGFHLSSKRVSPYSGHRSRVVDAGGIKITTYCGQFGLSFPCWELFRQFRDERARRICVDVASIVLHRTARNKYGMVIHADDDDFTIPDACYFIVTPLMIAYAIDRAKNAVYRDQAVYQLRTYNEIFLDETKGLAKTILMKGGIGDTYWTRATGWLLWSMTGVLRHLEPAHPEFGGFISKLRILADGIARAQDPAGSLHLFVDEPASPQETTGTAMCAMGLHEAVRKGWLAPSYGPVAAKAWEYVKTKITPEGRIVGAYTGWAVPAEKREIEMDKVAMGWIPGFILSAAAEMSTGR